MNIAAASSVFLAGTAGLAAIGTMEATASPTLP